MTRIAASTGVSISVLMLGLTFPATGAPGQTAALQPPALINKYCAGCHNQNLKSGGIALAGMNLSDVAANSGTLEKVLRKVHSGEMPPAGMPRPDATAIARPSRIGWKMNSTAPPPLILIRDARLSID